MSPKTTPQTRAKRAAAAKKSSSGFTAEERAAMKERVQELKAERGGKTDGESEVLAKIADMGESDRGLAERFHAIVTASAPELVPRTWYGMPAYSKDGKVLCYFRDARKFKTRYATVGFSDKANLDEGEMWPTDFALKAINADVEARISALVKKAVS
jgi:uncharacterized protein YdhG (YjbR/CyaY superfamily)